MEGWNTACTYIHMSVFGLHTIPYSSGSSFTQDFSLSLSHARSFAILCVFQERNVLFRHVIFEQSEFSSRLCHFVPDTTFRRKHPSI